MSDEARSDADSEDSPPGWTRHTLPVDRRDRPEPIDPERRKRSPFGVRRSVRLLFLFVLVVFIWLIIRIGSGWR